MQSPQNIKYLTINGIVVFDVSSEGHRENYVKFFASKTKGLPLIGKISNNILLIFRAKLLIITTFESSPYKFTCIAFFRSIFAKKTAIIILRPFSTSNYFRDFIKLIGQKFLTYLPRTQLFTIVPITRSHPLKDKATFLLDPEFWDIEDVCEARCSTELSQMAQKHATGRLLLACTGAFSSDKGLSQLADMMEHPEWPKDRIAVVAAGRFSQFQMATKKRLKASGAFVADRFISDKELFSIYTISQAAWVCYAPSRDMSSGVVGRALQFGVLPIIREGSVLEELLADPRRYMALPWQEIEKSVNRIKGLEAAYAANVGGFSVDKDAELSKIQHLIVGK